MHVRIVARPFGDAPEYIREAWIGFLLPVHPNCPHTVESRHVSVMRPINPPVMWLYGFIAPRARGYVVDTNVAMNLLESANRQQPNGGGQTRHTYSSLKAFYSLTKHAVP